MMLTQQAEREALREQLAGAQRSLLAERAVRVKAEEKLKQLTDILANSGLGLGLSPPVPGRPPTAEGAGRGGAGGGAGAGAAGRPGREGSVGASTVRSSSVGSLSSMDGSETSPPGGSGSGGARSRDGGKGYDERAMAALFVAASTPGQARPGGANR